MLLNNLDTPGREITLEINNEVSEDLIQKLSQNLKLIRLKRVGNNICIIDKQICWYGDLNFGGHSYSGASGLRIVNSKLARQTLSN